MKEILKKNKTLIKNGVFIILLIVLGLQFSSSFKELVQLVDENQVYKSTGYLEDGNVFLKGQVVLEEVLKRTDKQVSESYVKTSTLKIYTYKLLQTILLLFGVFMTLIFMAFNNKDYSLIETISEGIEE